MNPVRSRDRRGMHNYANYKQKIINIIYADQHHLIAICF
ncbi:MAG: hypothetical protein UX51_C0053G0003 [Candidatus Azambacteria bacterium GW2011_GWF2_46_32]|uniref:Uncharacterized protein n=1 Tax=Candidatus Azambacteria bacterium GW2011_GWF2_46_32 TaxID=1618628 RepID=A0A0G1SSM9_9BACT|nr:MAG: hypothetical protein UX51_C0053G0003 [Candidatus Azambacteria bacterium GW2011_GWF2_46_32]